MRLFHRARARLAHAVLAALLTLAVQAKAAADDPAAVTTEHSVATLVAATAGWAPGHELQLGLHLVLAPGWHTYWSNPGDAGLAPDATVALDGGKPAPVAFRFPSPHRLPTGTLMGYGYEGAVLLPFTVNPPDAAAGRLTVTVHAEWLVCANVCVPESADLGLALDQAASGTPAPAQAAPLFAAANAAMPRQSPFLAALVAGPRLRVTGAGIGPGAIADAWFIPDAPGVIDQYARQTLDVVPGAFTLALKRVGAAPLASLAGVLAIVDRSGQETDLRIDTARETGTPAASPPATVPKATPHLARLLVLAFLGGIVLNLMPCVFPILAMKAVALGRHGVDRRAMRASALLYTVGVLAAFLAIGLVMLALRSGGAEAGWGFQFQSPVFVALMTWLLFAVGLNFLGAFEIGAGLGGVGQGLASRGGAFGDVMTGVLAVVVASPCTAPFMGVAVAGALSGPPIAGLAVFFALGLGLATPYLVLGVLPGASRLVPRPGVWMDVLKQALAFPVLGACVWLLWVLAVQVGATGVLVGAGGLLLIGFAIWSFRLTQPSGAATTRAGIRFARATALAAVLVALSLLASLHPTGGARVALAADGFSAARLAQLRAAGRPVFVDMSAAWCITCLVNEHVALDQPEVRRAFASAHVAMLRGDWTRRDPAITAFLHQFGRDGVPLYVLFPAGDAPGRTLPQILTPGVVLAALGG